VPLDPPAVALIDRRVHHGHIATIRDNATACGTTPACIARWRAPAGHLIVMLISR
jgi:hypothetical protein